MNVASKPRVKPSGPCLVDGCESPCRTLGYCRPHYHQAYHGRPIRTPKQYRPSNVRDELGRKWCRTCDLWKPEADFASSLGKIDGLQSRCRACNAAIYQARRELVRDKMREKRFGLTREQFDAMFDAQGKRCAICHTDDPGTNYWAVDHDHACCPSSDKTCGGCVRGILCARCNHGLGSFRDRLDLLTSASEYLQGTRHARAAITRGAR